MQNDRAITQLPTMATAHAGLAADTVPAPTHVDNRAKAAIVVRLLLNEGADLPLEELPADLQARLTQKMGQMGLVDRTTLNSVVGEFAEILDGVGLSFPKGIAGALSALDGKISPQTAARLRKEAGVRQAGDPWDRLRALPITELAEIAQVESIEIAAVLLSKLETKTAAELLGKLPGRLARRITYAVSRTGGITPQVVDSIGLSLASQLDDRPVPAFAEAPNTRVGAILNQSAARTRDDMLSSLDETDADFAGAVRREIFTFAHIPQRVLPNDIPAVVRMVEPDVITTALAAATDDILTGVADFILSNMSTRMADNLREEITEKGAVNASDGDVAMNQVVNAIRQLEQAGDITLNTPAPTDDAQGSENN